MINLIIIVLSIIVFSYVFGTALGKFYAALKSKKEEKKEQLIHFILKNS